MRILILKEDPLSLSKGLARASTFGNHMKG